MSFQSFTIVRYPMPARARSQSSARWDVLVFPIAAILAFLLLWLRRPEALAAPRLWGPDGSVFYATYLTDGGLRSILEPYADFLDVIPRILMAFFAHASAAAVPAMIAAVSLVGTAFCCAFFALPMHRYLLRSDQVRIACCLAFAAVPYADGEIGTFTGLAWYAAIPATLLLSLPRRAYNGRPLWFMLVATLLVFLTALSTPTMIVFAPLALFKAYRGTSRVRIVSSSFLLGMIVQLMAYLVSEHTVFSARGPAFVGALANVIAYRVELQSVVGRFVAKGALGPHVAWIDALLIGITALTLVTYVRSRRKGAVTRRYAYIVPAGLALLVIAVLAGASGSVNAEPRSGAWPSEGVLLLPTALFFYCGAALFDALLSSIAREPFRAVAFAGFVVIGAFSNFALPALPSDHWTAAAPLIDQWRSARAEGRVHSALDIPIDPPGTTIYLPAATPSGQPG